MRLKRAPRALRGAKNRWEIDKKCFPDALFPVSPLFLISFKIFIDFLQFLEGPNPYFDRQARRILHDLLKSMLSRWTSNLVRFVHIFGTVVHPKP